MDKHSVDDGGIGCVAIIIAIFCAFYICGALSEIRDELRIIRQGMQSQPAP